MLPSPLAEVQVAVFDITKSLLDVSKMQFIPTNSVFFLISFAVSPTVYWIYYVSSSSEIHFVHDMVLKALSRYQIHSAMEGHTLFCGKHVSGTG